MAGLCAPWPLDPTCLPQGWSADPAQWTTRQRAAVRFSSSILYRLTAYQIGLCPVKVRPCRTPSDCVTPWWSVQQAGPVALLPNAGRWLGYGCGCSTTPCGCGPLSEITLDPPATTITQVLVDGQALPANAYRVDGRRKLVRVDGGRWPECQDLALPDTAPGTWSVAYQTGTPPELVDGADMANTALALEIDKACNGDTSCKLPKPVVRVVRDGIEYTYLNNFEAFQRGRTGLALVDMWLESVNPYSIKVPMQVYSPDTVHSRQQTTWPSPSLPNPAPGGAQSYVHVQSVPATVWTMVHNLGFYPGGVELEDNDGNTIVGAEISYPDINTVRAELSVPLSGVATIS